MPTINTTGENAQGGMGRARSTSPLSPRVRLADLISTPSRRKKERHQNRSKYSMWEDQERAEIRASSLEGERRAGGATSPRFSRGRILSDSESKYHRRGFGSATLSSATRPTPERLPLRMNRVDGLNSTGGQRFPQRVSFSVFNPVEERVWCACRSRPL